MNNKILLTVLFLSIAATGFTQNADSLFYVDSAYEQYDTAHYQTDDITTAQYTIKDPALLPVTQANKEAHYSKKNFNKEEWRKIIGETNYVEEEKEEKNTGPSSPVWTPALLKIIGFIVIFAVAIVVLYFLVKNAFADDSIGKKKSDADSLLIDNHIDEVTDQDIESLLRRALSNNDFRTAIRLYYIRLLKHLHSMNYIVWKKDKTNRDYSSELSTTGLIRDFKKITLAYEIIWYGERTPSPLEFEALQNNFTELHTKTANVSA